jgi:HAD superfamily hydrolase (TIGR01450 family)
VAWLIDLDGVVLLGGVPIAGSVAAVARLRAAGERVVFVTNFSRPTVAEQRQRLAAVGIEAEGDLATSAMAAAHLLEPGERVVVAAGPGVVEAIEARGARRVDGAGGADAVVVGLTDTFDYAMLTGAANAVRAGARLIGTNTDPTMPTPEGLLPGAGSLLAAVATASGATPTVAGKPQQPMADLVLEMAGPGPHTMVGDRWDTDGLFASRLGARFALVLSGVTPPDAIPAEADRALVAANLGELVERQL